MPVPKVNLRQRKGKKGISYFIDFKVNGKRQRLHTGTNKKLPWRSAKIRELSLP